MTHAWKPDGYSTVSPYLVVRDAAATIDFLTRVMNGRELRRFDDGKGRLMHAEVRIDDTVIMLGEVNEGWPAVDAHVHVYVPDVDAVYKKALDAGATSVQEPARKGDEDRRGGVKDPIGTTWWIATRSGEPG